ncbi:hypothetical protein H072_7190 [Dactylellina haptotyla CBS 200.50]|uniref:O-methyltransferase n=1 Tax=Dactylellina haptotyla (strain CBS 200.50) TaxID=1284197 RepID=S8A857_DACHA|nr:hypothetical protein H072_7190 [Dactylellina haptotyla CBS 200.50]
MSSPNPLVGDNVPAHILSLLESLHAESLKQESGITKADYENSVVDSNMKDKFIALEQDKCHFVYQLIRSTNAKCVVEAGTSFGVSTIYLALAVAANCRATGGQGKVIGTEHEPDKAKEARKYWNECGEIVSNIVDLREGDLRETLKTDLETVDFLLLDIWTPMALPTLQLVQPKLKQGAVIIADNTIGSAVGYKELLDYMRAPGSGFTNLTLPYHKGLEMSVYCPQA